MRKAATRLGMVISPTCWRRQRIAIGGLSVARLHGLLGDMIAGLMLRDGTPDPDYAAMAGIDTPTK